MRRRLTITLTAILSTGALSAQSPPPATDVLLVRSIRVEGNETTKEFIITREMSTQVGDTVDADQLVYDESRIYSLGLFNRVQIDQTSSDGAADLTVRVHERWYLYPYPILGFKYSDIGNLYYGLGVVHNNFRGRNEKVVFQFALGYDRWVQLIYQTPNLTGFRDVYFRLSLSAAREQNLSPGRDFYHQRTRSAQLTLGRRFGLHTLVQMSGGFETWDVSNEIAGGTLTPGGHDEFFTAGLNVSYDSRDIREYPTEGAFLQFNSMQYGFGRSAVEFFRYGADAAVFIPFASQITLAGRTHGQFSSGGAVPAYRYVYFGYRERIRGHFSRVLEGENLVGGNVELRVPILLPRYTELEWSPVPEFSLLRYGLYAAIFADAGKAWFRHEGFGGQPWYTGYGFGLHFLLPYSLVARSEVAWNPSGRAELVLDLGVSF